MIELPEPSAHMYPSDLERFQETETFAHAYSVKVGCPDETSTELYTADQLRTCIKKAAAEAREQMREELLAKVRPQSIVADGLKLLLKELP